MRFILRGSFMFLWAMVLLLTGTDAVFADDGSSSGVFGWAGRDPSVGAVGTTGGKEADADHRYFAGNRNDLIMALYPDAVIAEDGGFTSVAGADDTPKIIYVIGRIDLSTNKSGEKLEFEDFKDSEFDFDRYIQAYRPSVWNIDPANWDADRNRPLPVSGPLEDARVRSMRNQERIVSIAVGSNTSLIGLGRHAGIENGQIRVKDVENVIIRNISFKDAFDHFPQWDPKDSYKLDPTQPGCRMDYADEAGGPHMCPGGRWNSEYDNVQVNNAEHVWIDHCSFSDGRSDDYKFPSVFEPPHVGYDYLVQHHDGAVDVTGASNYVTISYNHFKDHDKTNLLGSSNTVKPANGWGALNITVAFNYYENAGQRMPRVRFGKVHVYNNFYSGRIGYLGAYAPTDGTSVPKNRFLYGIGIGHLAKLFVENNVFEIKDAPRSGSGDQVDSSVIFYVWHNADQEVDGVMERTCFFDSGTLLNGEAVGIMAAAQAASVAAGRPALLPTDTVWTPGESYDYTLLPSDQVKRHVLRRAGAGKL